METVMKIHKAGIAHNDLRPPNLCLDEEGNPVVIDMSHANHDATYHQKFKDIQKLWEVFDLTNELRKMARPQPAQPPPLLPRLTVTIPAKLRRSERIADQVARRNQMMGKQQRGKKRSSGKWKLGQYQVTRKPRKRS